jgi:hypothetical protein
MTKPGFEPRKIEMRVEHSNHFTIRTLKLRHRENEIFGGFEPIHTQLLNSIGPKTISDSIRVFSIDNKKSVRYVSCQTNICWNHMSWLFAKGPKTIFWKNWNYSELSIQWTLHLVKFSIIRTFSSVPWILHINALSIQGTLLYSNSPIFEQQIYMEITLHSPNFAIFCLK